MNSNDRTLEKKAKSTRVTRSRWKFTALNLAVSRTILFFWGIKGVYTYVCVGLFFLFSAEEGVRGGLLSMYVCSVHICMNEYMYTYCICMFIYVGLYV